MKKILTLLLTLLMAFTLVGCGSKQEEVIKEETIEQTQEVVEPIKEEPELVGGFIDVEDGTLTDELKDIFTKALEGLLGASYEPVELVATQVVAGTNYKFLANGTKTTNPITKGTYYVTVYEDLQGNVSLLDIETIEEKQEQVKEEVNKQDITQMSFWVVFYDQYGNELQRETLKYGTVPEYKSWLPEGFDNWVYKNTGRDVGTLKAITGNTYYQAVCHEVYHSSSDPTPEPVPTPTVTNYTVSFNLNGITGTTPTAQTIKEGENVIKPADPTDAIHTFAGWYKTKDAITGALSNPWNFDTDTVTTDMTLYAQWTRRIDNIITDDFPTTGSDVPEDAWINNANPSIRIYARTSFFNKYLFAIKDGAEMTLASCGGASDNAKKNGNSYTYNNAAVSIIFNMTSGDKLESIEIIAQDDANDDYKSVVGTYIAPVKVTFISEGGGTVKDSNENVVTNIFVPSGTTFSVNGSTITIGGIEYTAVTDEGYVFNSFIPNSGTITTNIDISVNFSEPQP